MSPKCDNAEIGSTNFEAINNNRSLFNFKPKKSASGAKDGAKDDDDDSGEQQEQQPQKTVKRKKGKSTAGEGVVSDEAKKALQKLSDPDVVFHNAQSLLERIELLGLHDEIKLVRSPFSPFLPPSFTDPCFPFHSPLRRPSLPPFAFPNPDNSSSSP